MKFKNICDFIYWTLTMIYFQSIVFNQITVISIQEKAFEIAVSKISFSLLRRQCVRYANQLNHIRTVLNYSFHRNKYSPRGMFISTNIWCMETNGALWQRCLYMMTSSNGTFSALLAFCAGKSLVTGEFLSQRPVTRSFDVFFDLRLNKQLSKQSWGWWFETPSR